MRQGGVILAAGRVPCAFEVEKTKKKHEIPPIKTHHEIHSSPATATTSSRRATKHVPRVSPYSHASFIDPGFVEIGLACVLRTRTAAVPLAYVLVLYFLASADSFATAVVCISGYGVVRWCLTLSFP